MKKFITGLGLAALVLSASKPEIALAADKGIPCAPEKEIRYVVSEIPKHFKQVRLDTYLIEYVPEAKNEYGLGGQLTVFLIEGLDFSVFDRTDTNPSNWYGVSNRYSVDKGCAGPGLYLTSGPAKFLSSRDTQTKFNAFIDKVKNMIQYMK